MFILLLFLCSVVSYINCEVREIRSSEGKKQHLQTNEIVKLQYYYESLCPDSIRSYTEQLHPVVSKLKEYLDLYTYPFGNGKINSDGTFTCQHGPKECYGNILHACAIDILKAPEKYVEFNACLIDKRSTDKAADKCGQTYSVDSQPIKACAKSDKGLQLLKNYAEETIKEHVKFVPYILINGKLVDYEEPLMPHVCAAFTNPPKACCQKCIRY